MNKFLRFFVHTLIFAIVFFSGHAVGIAGKAECKEALDGRTGFAVPPPVFRKDQQLIACMMIIVDEQNDPPLPPHMKCFYRNESRTACSVLFDMPGEKQWLYLGLDCATGLPLKERKL